MKLKFMIKMRNVLNFLNALDLLIHIHRNVKTNVTIGSLTSWIRIINHIRNAISNALNSNMKKMVRNIAVKNALKTILQTRYSRDAYQNLENDQLQSHLIGNTMLSNLRNIDNRRFQKKMF